MQKFRFTAHLADWLKINPYSQTFTKFIVFHFIITGLALTNPLYVQYIQLNLGCFPKYAKIPPSTYRM